jgi:hypothetical protein
LIVQDAALRSGHRFVTVRFGNVLGSRGSVVPLFKRQVELGGPITITHPEVKRFFMTIPEAVQLVLQAATMGEGGEVFVLDMGDQIKIVDLARDLIRLSGLEEGRDVDIVFTGLRQGEKLYEELFYETDKIERTQHEKILVCRNGFHHGPGARPSNGNGHGHRLKTLGYESPLRLDVDTVIEAAEQGELEIVRVLLRKLVPQYHAPVQESHEPLLRTSRQKSSDGSGSGVLSPRKKVYQISTGR